MSTPGRTSRANSMQCVLMTVLLCSVPAACVGTRARFLKTSADLARKSVVRYCDLSFIECKRDTKNPSVYKTLGGTFGMGVFADILNTHESGVDIYSNLGLDGPGKIRLDKDHLVSPNMEQRIPVFIKVAQDDTASQAERRSMSRKIGYFQKEMLRARTFGRKGFGPEYYDVIYKRNAASHPLHKSAYIMRELQGKNGAELVNDFNVALMKSLRLTLTRMLGLYQLEAIIENSKFKQTREMSELVIAEAWQWILPSLDMIKSILLFLKRMWSKNLHHCDFHLSNVMFIHDLMDNYDDIQTLIRNHAAFSADAADSIMMESSAPVQTVKTPMNMYQLSENRIQAIDLAYAIDLDVKGNSTCKANPCLVYRAERSEDTCEFHRSLVHAQQVLSKCDAIWINVKKKMRQGYPYFARMENDLPDVMSSLDRAFGVMSRYFGTLAPRVLDVAPTWNECLKNKEEYVMWLKRQRSDNPEVRLQFPSDAEHKCTVAGESQGLLAVLSMLESETSHLCRTVFPLTPEFSDVLCDKISNNTHHRGEVQTPRLPHRLPRFVRERAAMSPLGLYSL
eukprot:Lankesteria_metandrocarpae@DN4609_c0_g1_i2.p1